MASDRQEQRSGAGMTVDALAARAGATTRSIRNYQTQGLLAPPNLVGRVGYYDEGHLHRLRLIARLQGQGFSLAGIAGLLQAWEQGRDLADVLGLEQALGEAWSDEEPELLSAAELAERFPEAVKDLALAQRAFELGLVVAEGEHFRVPSPNLLRGGREMARAGIPLAATQDELAALQADMARVAERFVGLFERHVWEPFAAAGLPAEQLPEVTDALRRLRPLAAQTVAATLARAMEEASAASAAAQAAAAARSRPRSEEAS